MKRKKTLVTLLTFLFVLFSASPILAVPGLGGLGLTINDFCIYCHGGAGYGTNKPHRVHTQLNDRGPGNLNCDSCHAGDTPIPVNDGSYVSGPIPFKDGVFTLEETTVCDQCHSTGGDHDGVGIIGSFGAKNIWREYYTHVNGVYTEVGGVYTDDGKLKPGMEQWCVTCHDDAPSTMTSSQGVVVAAPNVGGAFYTRGHGSKKLGEKQIECGDCHDFNKKHIDFVQRSFKVDEVNLNRNVYDATETYGGTVTPYTASYRLKSIDGHPAMQIPRYSSSVPWSLKNKQYALCLNSGCHDSGKVFGKDESDMTPEELSLYYLPGDITYTNLFNQNSLRLISFGTADGAVGNINGHKRHLGKDARSMKADNDWDGIMNNSSGATTDLPTCISCHNVHGSSRPAMIRDGTLTGRNPPGLNAAYVNDLSGTRDNSTTYENSLGISFAYFNNDYYNSWRRLYASQPDNWNGICNMCHGSFEYYRQPNLGIARAYSFANHTAEYGSLEVPIEIDANAGTATESRESVSTIKVVFKGQVQPASGYSIDDCLTVMDITDSGNPVEISPLAYMVSLVDDNKKFVIEFGSSLPDRKKYSFQFGNLVDMDGNGLRPGTDLNFDLIVLQGDVDGNGIVNSQDKDFAVERFGNSIISGGTYKDRIENVRSDVNKDGVIDQSDDDYISARLGNTL